MSKPLYLIKIGGSVITHTNRRNSPNLKTLDRIIMELKEASKDKNILVGHGSGSFAHVPAHEYKVNLGLINKNSRKGASITQHAAANLNRIVVDRMIKHGINAISFPASGGALAKSGKIQRWDLSPLKKALENEFVPVTYGDVVEDTKQGVSIVSTEGVFTFLAAKLRPQRIILATDVDGFLDKDPKIHKDARLISKVDGKNIKRLLNYAGGSRKVDVTGGMRSKLLLLHDLVKKSGATGYIINGAKKGILQKLLAKDRFTGTEVLP